MKVAARRAIVAVLLAAFFAQAAVAVTRQSAVWDETQYFGIGKYLLEHFRWDIPGAITHPPLTFYLCSIPLLFENDSQLGVSWRKTRDVYTLGSADFLRGQAILASPANRNDRLLIASRLMMTLASLLLGFAVYRFGAALYGERSGLLALFFFAFSPNLLAYAGLAVPDMLFTICAFLSLWFAWSSMRQGGTVRFVLAGLFLGLALLTKLVALLLLPLEISLYLVFMARERRNLVRPVLLLFGVALFVLLAGYGFDLTPFVQGARFHAEHAKAGMVSFLMGKYSTHGWWYFYLVALLVKTPVPALLLALLAAVLGFRDRSTDRFDLLFLLAPVLVFLVATSAAPYSVGIRYLLPVYPFLFVLIGGLASRGKKVRIAAYVCALWFAVSSLASAPHYLAYFNEAAGGPSNGYRWLVDSNLDWGQDLKGLKQYLDRKGIGRISLSYFGSDSPARYGIVYDWLPSFYLADPATGSFNGPSGAIPVRRYLAISATNLQGVYFVGNENRFRWLDAYRPVAKIGYSIFVYDLGRPSR